MAIGLNGNNSYNTSPAPNIEEHRKETETFLDPEDQKFFSEIVTSRSVMKGTPMITQQQGRQNKVKQ